jgi:preprotein translocase SecE subunit
VEKIISYFQSVKDELAKVEWPKAAAVVKLTLIVLVITAAVALWVGGLDIGFTKALEAAVSLK